jgi:hypothetical protein
LTTTGIVRLAIAANEGGRVSSAARLAELAGDGQTAYGTAASNEPSAKPGPKRDANLTLNMPNLSLQAVVKRS